MEGSTTLGHQTWKTAGTWLVLYNLCLQAPSVCTLTAMPEGPGRYIALHPLFLPYTMLLVVLLLGVMPRGQGYTWVSGWRTLGPGCLSMGPFFKFPETGDKSCVISTLVRNFESYVTFDTRQLISSFLPVLVATMIPFRLRSVTMTISSLLPSTSSRPGAGQSSSHVLSFSSSWEEVALSLQVR